MPSLTELIATSVLLTPPVFAFNPPKLSPSISPPRTSYLPPYGTIRSSLIVSARDYDNYEYEYSSDGLDDINVGNFWTNPTGGLDRYPSSSSSVREKSYNGFMEDEVTVSGGRAGAPRKQPADWWETKRMPESDGYDDYYDEDEEDGEYGLPPPSRSRSSFRSGAPPPPRPVRDFYNKLFWFGFDPSTTRSTDRTMFGGTRGKFNAMSLLRDREIRQQNKRSMRGKRSYDPAIQDFGDVREWNERKMGTSPAGGKDVGDDAVVEQIEEISDMNRAMWLPPGEEGIPMMDTEFDPVMEEPFLEDDEYWQDDLPPPRSVGRRRYSSRDRYYDDDDDDDEEDDFDFELERRPRSEGRRRNRRRRNGRSQERRGWDLFSLSRSKRSQADAYDTFIGLGPRYGEYDDEDDEYDVPRSRRRAGFAYKYSREYDDDDDYDMDDDIIDVRPKRSLSRRRSWEDRAMEMDRIPPRSVTAWGPSGRLDRDAQTLAAVEAEREIKKAQRYLDKKEDMVDDAKEEVVSLKADASFYEKQLDQGRETKVAKQELGYIIRDIEDASRILRMAKAERDAAMNKLDRLKSKHWALLSEYDAARSFELD